MTAQIEIKPRGRDLLNSLNVNTYREAYKRGMNLSAYLEEVDPSGQYDRKDREGQLDAFGRMLMAAGIQTRSIEQLGYWASKGDVFLESEHTRALLPEFFSRVWRSVSHKPGSAQKRANTLYDTSDGVPGSWLNPYIDAAQARWDEQIAPAIPVSEVTALTTPISGRLYRAFYMTHDASKERMLRVSAGAPLPKVKVASTDRSINLYKYGRAMEITYEDLRDMRVDRIAMHVANVAVQAEIDKLATIIDVIVNGDGNANTAAANYALNTLDSTTTTGVLTLKGWLAFKMKFANPYVLTTALTREDSALKMMLLNMGSANVPLVQVAMPSGFGYFSPINPGLADNTRLGWTGDAPANVVVGIDRRRAIERVVEIGGDIAEVENVIQNQTRVFTLSEVEGYAVLDQNAANTLTLTF